MRRFPGFTQFFRGVADHVDHRALVGRHGEDSVESGVRNAPPTDGQDRLTARLDRIERFGVACGCIGLDIDAFPVWPDDPSPAEDWLSIAPMIDRLMTAKPSFMLASPGSDAATITSEPAASSIAPTLIDLAEYHLSAIETGLRALGFDPDLFPLQHAGFAPFWRDCADRIELVVRDRVAGMDADGTALLAFGRATDIAPGRPAGDPLAASLQRRFQRSMHDQDQRRRVAIERLAWSLDMDPIAALIAA